MNSIKIMVLGILVLCMAAPPAEAQNTTERIIGSVIGALANQPSGYHDAYPYGYSRPLYRPYGYRPLGYRTYRSSYGTGLPFGASYYVDEGDYRNFKDAYGRQLGRIPLWQL